MLAKCANPACDTPFRYLRDGRVFQVEVDAAGGYHSAEVRAPGPVLVSDHKPPHRLEHFWLCGACSRTMTLVFDKAQGVATIPLVRAAKRAAAAS